MQIGQLFILRINIHLQGSVLDSPELMWAEPQLEPIYGAVRSYLEMDQRVGLLTERLDVIADLLAVLKDQVRTSHGEYLEWIGEISCILLISVQLLLSELNTNAFTPLFRIRHYYWLSLTLARLLTLSSITVIVLIAAEIIVAAVNIVVDLYAGVD